MSDLYVDVDTGEILLVIPDDQDMPSNIFDVVVMPNRPDEHDAPGCYHFSLGPEVEIYPAASEFSELTEQ
eukprot:1996655-Heterocapsa_arctica.AAC.1